MNQVYLEQEMALTMKRLLFSAMAYSTLLFGCGGVDDTVHKDTRAESEGGENVAESAQGLIKVLRGGQPGVTMEDTGLLQASPNANQGNTDRFYVGMSGTSQAGIGLLKWDLSSIPQGSTISSAILKITTYSAFGGVAPEVHRATRAWTEANATWNSMSTGYDPAIVAQFAPLSVVGSYVSATKDIAPLVQGWVSGTYANDGLALVGAPVPGRQGAFYSSEVSDPNFAPELTITYDLPFCVGKMDGTMCNDGNACTQADTCVAGVCVGSNPVVCPSMMPCQANACNPATGTCSATPLPNGTACNDGNLCTPTSSCQGGMCIGSSTIPCPPPDACHLPGVCQPATGTCSLGASIAADTLTGLANHWKFDEASGLALNSVGTATGVLNASATRGPSFDGTNAVIVNPTSTSDAFAGVGFATPTPIAPNATVSLWFKAPKPTVSGRIFSTNDQSFVVKLSTLGSTFLQLPNAVSHTSGVIADNTWHHLTFVRRSNGFVQYVDGVESTNSALVLPASTMGGVKLGMQGGATSTNGAIQASYDDFRIYNRALSACDALTLAHEVPSTAETSPCPPAAIGTWTGDDTLLDSSGSHHGASGTDNGAMPVAFGPGRFSRAFALNGQSYVTIPHAAALQFNTAMTMSAWVYTSAAGGRILGKRAISGSTGYALETQAGNLRMLFGINVVTATTPLPTNRWVHVAGTWDGTVGVLYVDGAAVKTYAPPTPQTIGINGVDLRIGADAVGAKRWDGSLDHVAVYNGALTYEQIHHLATAVPPAMPVGWWNAENTMNDASGSNNHGASGTLNGATPVTYTAGKVSKAFNLNGSSYVAIPHASKLMFTDKMTLSAWIYPNTIMASRILDKSPSAGGSGYLLEVFQGAPRFILAGNSVLHSPSALQSDAWSHVAATWDGAISRLYVNGVQVAQGMTMPGPIPSNTLPLLIGADSNGGRRFPGYIDEAAVYDVALTKEQIEAMAIGGAPATLANECQECGNGILDVGEECDKGEGNAYNLLSTCTTQCTNSGLIALFSAKNVSGSMGNMDGIPVSTWIDLVGGKNATQATTTKRPVYRTNALGGGPAVQFDGVDDALFAPIDINYTKYPKLTIAARFQNTAGVTALYSGVWGHDNGGFDRFLISGGTGPQGIGISSGSAVVAVPGITVTNVPLLVTAVLNNGGGAGSSTVYVNDTPALSFAENHTNAGATEFGIGTIQGPPGSTAAAFKGYLDYIAIYDRNLSATEVYRMQCGNGTVDAGEECDGGEDNADDLLSACSTECRRTGLIALFSAESINGGSNPTNGSAVTTWVDLVGAKNATQTTATKKPIYHATGMGGGPGLLFDGVDDALFAPININYTAYPKLTVVARFQNATGVTAQNSGVWGHDNGGYDRFLISGGSGAAATGISNGSSVIAVPGLTATAVPLVAAAVLNNGGGTNSSSVYLNGSLAKTFAENHGNAGSNDFGIGTIQGPPGSTISAFKGYISHIAIYDRNLTADEIQAIQSSL